MRRFFLAISFMQAMVLAHAQLVADHTVVDHYVDIPQQYLDSVMTMLVSIPGESHSEAYRIGQFLLERLDNRFQVELYVGSPPAMTDQYLRMGMHRNGGEYLFFNESRILEMKAEMDLQNASGNPFHVMGFAWCWDMTNDNDPGGIEDSVFHVRWAGRSEEGPDGNLRWGLDSTDVALTGNRVTMDTYLQGVESYIRHCTDHSYPTKWIFTTGPVDNHGGTENGFQREIKHDYIRNYVAGDSSRILFDYADILCWSNGGEKNTVIWNDQDSLRPHAQIHPENMMDYDNNWNLIPHTEDGDHIGEVGAMRLARAMWWLLARMAGWDGKIPVREIQLYSTGDTLVMTGQDLQLQALVLPEHATSKELTWSVIGLGGTASISPGGLLRGGMPGEVQVVARASSNPGVADTLALTVTDPLVPVAALSIETIGEVRELAVGDSLQCIAFVLPENASNPAVIWSIINLSGSAGIGADGWVRGLGEGRVQVLATAEDGSGLADTLELHIGEHLIRVTSIAIRSAGDVSSLASGSSLQFTAEVLPEDASNSEVSWSVLNGLGTASITPSGLLTAGNPGSVAIVAAATDGSHVADTFYLDISAPLIPVDSIAVVPEGGISTLESGSALQFSALVYPGEASNTTVDWSIVPGSGSGSVTATGLLTAGLPGTVQVVATATDGSGVTGTCELAITPPSVPVTGIELAAAGGITSLESGQHLQFTARVFPENASNKHLAWSINELSGTASINAQGLLSAWNPGGIEVLATAQDGSGVQGSYLLDILPAFIEVQSVVISAAGNVSSVEAGDMLQLFATVTPPDASNPGVIWHVSSGSGTPVGSITSTGLFIALGEGQAEALAIAQDGSEKYDTYDITVTATGTSAGEPAMQDLIRLYPNPGTGRIHLHLGDLQTHWLRVIDIRGTVVLELVPDPRMRVMELDLSRQPDGIYYVQVSDGQKLIVKPIIISK